MAATSPCLFSQWSPMHKRSNTPAEVWLAVGMFPREARRERKKRVECTRILRPAEDRCGAGMSSCRPPGKRTVACGAQTTRPPEKRPRVQLYYSRQEKIQEAAAQKTLHSDSCTACRRPHSQPHRGPDETAAIKGWEMQVFAAFLPTDK